MTSKNGQGVRSISEDLENELQIYVKLFTILYAYDTVLLAGSADELQSELNYIYEYCEKWNLKLNKQIQCHGFYKGDVTDQVKF